jgi:hypothetical protein
MTVHVEDLESGEVPGRGHRPRWFPLVAVGAAVILLVIGGLVLGVSNGLFHPQESRALPSFPSLSAQPDPSLHGTVAYFDGATGCVRIIAASGQASKDVLCISAQDLAVKPELGLKPAGPQLVWLSGDRLEVTMFLWKPSPGTPVYSPGWQKVVDVKTGAVAAIAAAQVPSSPNVTTQPTLAPNGDRVSYTFNSATGRVAVTLTNGSGASRTLLSTRGPGEYTYRFGPVFWAPTWKWIAASDVDRILVLTPGTPSQTRVLVTGLGMAGGGNAGPAFAITASDLFAAAK